MFRFKIIASGSKGNAYLLQSGSSRLLLECGIPIKKLQESVRFKLTSIAGCLLTHEHKDHSYCVNNLLNKGIDVYCSQGTAEALGIANHHRVKVMKPKRTYQIDRFMVMGFEVVHDASEPFGFLIKDKYSKEKMLFATDTAYLPYKFKNLTHIAVECNYNADLLKKNVEEGVIPALVAKRVIESHMPEEEFKEFIKDYPNAEIYAIHQSGVNI